MYTICSRRYEEKSSGLFDSEAENKHFFRKIVTYYRMLLTNHLLRLTFRKIIVILQTEQKPKNDENSCCRCHRTCGWRYAESA